MISKKLDLITKSDLDALVADSVPEGKTIDYKESLPSTSDGDKKEFLKDVSSFANASGGDLIYGVKERRDASNRPTGIPESIPGLAAVNVDQERLRLDQLIRTGIAPRISGVQIAGVDGFPGGPVLIVRVPKSWSAPHMVTLQSESRFFSRTNSGKYPLDVGEIRAAFALSDNLAEKVRRFRDERLARIVADETPVPLIQGPRVILQLIPLSALTPATIIDVDIAARHPDRVRLLHGGGIDIRRNFDGVLFFDARPPQASSGYLQVYRNGILEAADGYIVGAEGPDKLIPSALFESGLIDSLRVYLGLMENWGVDSPVLALLTLMGVRGCVMASSDLARRRAFGQIYPIDRDMLVLPEVLVEDFRVDIGDLLKPTLDAVWQSSGWVGSPNYIDGKWMRQV